MPHNYSRGLEGDIVAFFCDMQSEKDTVCHLQANFRMDVFENGPVEGFCGFFDVQFRGSEQNPADHDILLSTAPDPTGSTHWGQQSFVLHPPIACMPGETLYFSALLCWVSAKAEREDKDGIQLGRCRQGRGGG